MNRLADRYPGYGWETNVGYGTRRHLEGLRERGLTPFHRTAYAPVRAFILQPTTFDDLIDQLDTAEAEAEACRCGRCGHRPPRRSWRRSLHWHERALAPNLGSVGAGERLL